MNFAQIVRDEMRRRGLTKKQLADELKPTKGESGAKISGVSKSVLYDFLQLTDPPNHINSESLGHILEALDFKLIQPMDGKVYAVCRHSDFHRTFQDFAVCKTRAEAQRLAEEVTKSSGIATRVVVQSAPTPPPPAPVRPVLWQKLGTEA